VIYNLEKPSVENNIPILFLAGPTPRDAQTKSWRPEALTVLRDELQFKGYVVVPENRGFIYQTGYDHHAQVSWERHWLDRASCVIFWVPRALETMPAFTTNIEFGYVAGRGQSYVLGYPPSAEKMKYLHHVALEQAKPLAHDLAETLRLGIEAVTKA
jgi:hypothetical protein